MKIGIVLTYSDIFNDTPPKVEDLLKEIPSKLTIGLFSLVNSYLYLGDGNSAFYNLFGRIGVIPTAIIKDKIANNDINIFSIASTLKFIEYEILNYRELKYEDTIPRDELKIFKAYLIISQNNEKRHDISLEDRQKLTTENFFYNRGWSILLYQYQFTIKTDPFIQMIKGVLFLNHFLSHKEYSQYVTNYLNTFQTSTVWNYSLNLIEPLTHFDKKLNHPIFHLKAATELSIFFNNFSLKMPILNKTLSPNFIDIKDKPLLKYSDENFIVIYWDFLIQKIFNGLIHDFTNKSGILEHPDFKNGQLKSYIGKKISEKIIFKKITNYCFYDASYTCKLYDEKSIKGFPDLYYRNGSHVFIFEFKDISISSLSIDDYSSKNFINEIEKKIIKNEKGEPKGITQLTNFISVLESGTLDIDPFITENKQKVTIYPIVVYTDKILSAPGVNKFFKDKFNILIDENISPNTFKRIHDVVFIDVDFFINNCRELKSKKIKLKYLIEKYNTRIKNKEKKHLKDNDIDRFHSIYESFENSSKNLILRKKDFMDVPTIKELVKEFNLTEHLPKG